MRFNGEAVFPVTPLARIGYTDPKKSRPGATRRKN